MAKQINFGGALLKQFGAYIRTDLTGLVDINGVASGVIGLVGLAEKGPVNKAVTINGYTQLVEVFGDGPLVRHGLAAYVGGASQLVCVRTGDPAAAQLTAIEVDAGASDYTFVAREMGSLGNNIFISVETNDAGTASPATGDDTYVLRIKYIDSRGNDIRETFVVPRYIPDRTGMYFNTNTGDFYVLRDRESGIIRDIPSTWGFGNADEDAFLQKVEDLKASTEDLVGPFPYGTGDNPYPLALIASVINNGGLGQAPSSLVMLTDANPPVEELLTVGYTYDPLTAEELLEHPFVQLSGGDNGDDGTNFYGIVDDISGDIDYNMTFDTAGVMDVWDESLGIMEDEEVNFIQPAYLFNYKRNSDGSLSDTLTTWTRRYGFFKALMPKFLAHLTTMSNIQNRKFRTMVAGLPYYKVGDKVNASAQDFLDDIEDISGLINNDRVQLWAGGFQSRAFSSRLENYGGEMLASFAVGAHASREVSVSLTFAQLSGIFTDGLEFSFNSAQKDELYTRSHAFVMKRRNSVGAVEYVAAHNYTSFTGASSRGLQLFITRRIVDYMNSFVYKNLEENFIGRKSRGRDTEVAISELVSALLTRLVREDVLVAFANVNVYADANDKTVYYVEYDFQPVTEIDFIPVTNKLLYTLA